MQCRWNQRGKLQPLGSLEDEDELILNRFQLSSSNQASNQATEDKETIFITICDEQRYLIFVHKL